MSCALPSPVSCLCQLKQAGTMCRGPAGACDLPEYCTGASPYCPANVYLLDGSSCQYGLAYCYNGMCLTHEQQCLQLWGYGNLKSVSTHTTTIHILYIIILYIIHILEQRHAKLTSKNHGKEGWLFKSTSFEPKSGTWTHCKDYSQWAN